MRSIASLCLIVLLGSQTHRLSGQGLETFANFGATGTSYQDGSFEGQDGSTWTYVQCRGDYTITGKALMLGRNRAPQSNVYSGTISGGIGILSFNYSQAFATNVNLNVLVNDVVVGNVKSLAEQGVTKNSGNIIVNVEGDFVLKFINVLNGDGQVVIDDVAWTAYTPGINQPPVISDVAHSPESGITSSTGVSVSAQVSDDNAVSQVQLFWALTSDVYPGGNAITMTESGGIYTTDSDIPAQADGTTVYYLVYAEDDEGDFSLSSAQSYVVRDPRTTAIPYSEAFEVDLGDCYTFSVSGDSKWWRQGEYSSNGYAMMNGFDSGDIEEDWLILPGINLDNYSNEALQFETSYLYGIEDADNYLKLFYSTDYNGVGDPTLATWTELPFDKPVASGTWTPSGLIDLSSVSGNSVWIGFKYHYEPGNYRWWMVDNVVVFTDVAPAAYPTQFKGTVTSLTSIMTSWTDALPPASGYLVKGSTAGFNGIAAPSDGVMEADGLLVRNIGAGTEGVEFPSLNPNTRYYFQIFPYNGSGTSVRYKTDEITPRSSVRTSAFAQNLETFENLVAGSSYINGTFTGQDGSEWTFEKCRGDFEILGKAIMIGRNQSPRSNFYSGTISGGIGGLNFDYSQAFSTDVQLNVLVNDVVVATVTSSGETGVIKNSGDIPVNIPGDFVLKFINVNNGDGQVVVDNVSWSPYQAPPVPVPLSSWGLLLSMAAILLAAMVMFGRKIA